VSSKSAEFGVDLISNGTGEQGTGGGEAQSAVRSCHATPEELIQEARNGRMFILVDDEDRENEGDLVIPAQMATPDAVNFMARFGRGLICLALTAQRARELELEPQSKQNGTQFETAFLTTIEAKTGVTTGISAADRARTIAVAINAGASASDIVTPGHVFPLAARDGGVLVRAGHTEAAVDISRLAGLMPAGVICEILNDDGTMARLPDLERFAEIHDLKIGTIRDLIAYRRRYDHLVERLVTSPFQSDYGGDWKLINYRNTIDGSDCFVIQKGEVTPEGETLVRVHAASIFSDILGQPGPRKLALQRAMEQIGRAGAGVVVLLPIRPSDWHKVASPDEIDNEVVLRAYGIGAQILADLGVTSMRLLSNSPNREIKGLEGYGLSICEFVALE
jgi:3,4-dihydroxy 2-butanone 4-phosphate synthase / GTP cyclohydrolase II